MRARTKQVYRDELQRTAKGKKSISGSFCMFFARNGLELN